MSYTPSNCVPTTSQIQDSSWSFSQAEETRRQAYFGHFLLNLVYVTINPFIAYGSLKEP